MRFSFIRGRGLTDFALVNRLCEENLRSQRQYGSVVGRFASFQCELTAGFLISVVDDWPL